MAKVTPKITRHSDLRVSSYTHKDIEVWVQIDYIAGKISLINALQSTHGINRVEAKKWVFAERELEYMKGWQDILDAMKNAINLATIELATYANAKK